MKERPIIMTAESVQAILEGKKTQTRRVVKQDPAGKIPFTDDLPCPYGTVGDRLWVRETFGPGMRGIVYRADNASVVVIGNRWNSPIHMSRFQSRITLEIVSLRLQRIQEINEADARVEGITDPHPIDAFAGRWDAINAKRRCWFDLNPWVWVIEFKQVQHGS